MARQAQAERKIVELKFEKTAIGSNEFYLATNNSGMDYIMTIGQQKQKGLELAAYQKLIPALIEDPKILGMLKGLWVYTDGIGMDKKGIHMLNEHKELISPPTNSDKEKLIDITPGINPLSLCVHTDNDFAKCGFRFELRANFMPFGLTTIAIGVKPERLLRLEEGEVLEVKTKGNQTIMVENALEARILRQ